MCAILFLVFCTSAWAQVLPGVDVFCEEGHFSSLKGKRVGLLTNHTGVNTQMRSTLQLFQENAHVTAIFSPEHGLKGAHYAAEKIQHGNEQGISVYSLHGETRRPTSIWSRR